MFYVEFGIYDSSWSRLITLLSLIQLKTPLTVFLNFLTAFVMSIFVGPLPMLYFIGFYNNEGFNFDDPLLTST